LWIPGFWFRMCRDYSSKLQNWCLMRDGPGLGFNWRYFVVTRVDFEVLQWKEQNFEWFCGLCSIIGAFLLLFRQYSVRRGLNSAFLVTRFMLRALD
jgi:hypothetical protein